MIHLSERERMEICEAPLAMPNSRASMAEAPPPMMASFLPLASTLFLFSFLVSLRSKEVCTYSSSLEEWTISPLNLSEPSKLTIFGSPQVPMAAMRPS